jgi:hypothetical protein
METYRILSCLCRPHNSLRSAYRSLRSPLTSLRSPQLVGFGCLPSLRSCFCPRWGQPGERSTPAPSLFGNFRLTCHSGSKFRARIPDRQDICLQAGSDFNNHYVIDKNVRYAVDALQTGENVSKSAVLDGRTCSLLREQMRLVRGKGII